MTRKFKTAGVLAAALAVLALTASAASAVFTSANYPASATGSSTGSLFDAFKSTVECAESSFHVGRYDTTTEHPGKHVGLTGPTETVTVTPEYNKCTVFGLPGTVNFTGCDFVFHNSSGSTSITTDLECPPSYNLDITAYTSSAHTKALCHVTVTPFTGKGGLQVHNIESHILLTGNAEGIVAHQSRTSALCPAGTETKEVKYTVQPPGITLAGSISVS